MGLALCGLDPTLPTAGGTARVGSAGDDLNTLYQNAAVVRGDSIFLPAGVYPATTIRAAAKSGTGRVTFWAVPGTVTIDGKLEIAASFVSVVGVDATTFYLSPRAEAAGTETRDVDVRDFNAGWIYINGKCRNVGYRHGVSRGPTQYVTQNPEVSASGSEEPDGLYFENVAFSNYLKNPATSDHIDALHPLAGRNGVIRGCTFEDFEHYGIIFTRTIGDGPQHWLIDNNWFGPSNQALQSVYLGNTASALYRDFAIRRNVGQFFSIGSNTVTDADSQIAVIENHWDWHNNVINTYPGLTLQNNVYRTTSNGAVPTGTGNSIDASLDVSRTGWPI